MSPEEFMAAERKIVREAAPAGLSSLPPGTRIRWLDARGKPREGTVTPWPDCPSELRDHVKVLETITSEVPHVMLGTHQVEVVG